MIIGTDWQEPLHPVPPLPPLSPLFSHPNPSWSALLLPLSRRGGETLQAAAACRSLSFRPGRPRFQARFLALGLHKRSPFGRPRHSQGLALPPPRPLEGRALCSPRLLARPGAAAGRAKAAPPVPGVPLSPALLAQVLSVTPAACLGFPGEVFPLSLDFGFDPFPCRGDIDCTSYLLIKGLMYIIIL